MSFKKFHLTSTTCLTSRLLLIEKCQLNNSYALTNFTRVKLLIELNALENFDSPRLLAALFLLTILGGSKPYVLKFTLFQTFHEKDYDAKVVLDLANSLAYRFVELMSFEVLPFLSKVDLSSYALKIKKGTMVNFTISDLSFIRVVETHSIFFK